MAIYMSDNLISYFFPVYDQDGQDIGADTVKDQWHYRTFDLSPYAGLGFGSVRALNTGGAPPLASVGGTYAACVGAASAANR